MGAYERMTDAIKKTIEQLQAATGLVGGAYTLVRGGKTDVTECFGFADAEAGRPVTERSFFDIASNSKAFTAMLGAIAADEGLFDWNAPVRRYMPEFAMTDEYAAAHMTGSDIACHRTGLARHEFMRAKVYTSIGDMARRTKYMEMGGGFREKYEYNNHMFIVLGHILERACGAPWRTLITEKIARPLGMEVRFRDRDWDRAGLDCALPYRTNGHGGAHRCEYADNPVAGPCGGIKTNMEGMTRWLLALANSGRGLCSEKAFGELIAPVIACADDGSDAELCRGYAKGWRTASYRGRFLVWHGGSINGFGSCVGFFPKTGDGFAVLTNTGSAWGAAILRDVMLDELCGAPRDDYSFLIDEWRDMIETRDETLLEYRAARPLTPEEAESFTGEFYHPAYDEFTLSRRDGEIWLEYGSFGAALRMCADGSALACEDDAAPDYMRLRRDGQDLACSNSDLAMQLRFERKG